MSDLNRGPHPRGRDWVRSNIVGLVALFVALSGTTYAAQSANDGPQGKKAAKKKAKRGPAGPVGAAGPAGPAGAAGAAGSPATNALTLGGLPASAYQQKCTTGAIWGFAFVDPTLLTGTYSNLTTGNVNCAGGTVQGRTDGFGNHHVKFNGSTAAFALVSCAIGPCAESSVAFVAGGEFNVLTGNSAGTLTPGSFYIITY